MTAPERRPAKQVLMYSLARALTRENNIVYFQGSELNISAGQLFEWCRATPSADAFLMQVKYLNIDANTKTLKEFFYYEVSNYWRDYGPDFGPSRFPYPLRRDMCDLALAECIDPMALTCADCRGSGSITDKITCKKCQGSGRVIFTDEERAAALGISPSDYFLYNWREFYQAIQLILKTWEVDALDACQ